MNITLVAGARPNFMKIAPIIKAIKSKQAEGVDITYRLVHTGQHYDKNMSGNFFEQLEIPAPDVNLECGGGTQAEQTAAIMVKFEKELQNHTPSIVIVVGDVTSTMACAISAKKLCIDVAHVEAGIRSGDMTMPEEINRIVTDAISDHFFTTSELANSLLRKNGIDNKAIHFVGNTMIDTLHQNMSKLVKPQLWCQYNLESNKYFLITLHRPSNVDEPANLSRLIDIILEQTQGLPVVFPLHPRTKKNLDQKYLENSKLIVVEPMGYLEFIFLVKNAKAIITDSGGITEEATVLNIPCVTLRNSTERPETVTMGSNELAGTDPNNLIPYLKKINKNEWKKSSIPDLWDGKSAVRIINKLIELY